MLVEDQDTVVFAVLTTGDHVTSFTVWPKYQKASDRPDLLDMEGAFLDRNKVPMFLWMPRGKSINLAYSHPS